VVVVVVVVVGGGVQNYSFVVVPIVGRLKKGGMS